MKKLSKRKISSLKLFRMLCLTLVLVVAMVFAVKSSASGLSHDTYREITVCPGDTLWSIAKEYRPNENIQKVIYEITVFNNMDTTAIYPGQKLKIPLKI